MSRAGFPLVFRDWTNPGLAAIWERFFADLAEGRGWYPPDPSPILWLSDLAHAEPAALPGIEAIVDELLDDPDPAHVLEGIIGVEGISSVPAQMRLAQRVAKGWNPHPDALRAAVSKLLLLGQWMTGEPALVENVAAAAEHAGAADLAERHCRLAATLAEPDRRSLLQGLGIVARARGIATDPFRVALGLPA